MWSYVRKLDSFVIGFNVTHNPLDILSTQSSISERSLVIDNELTIHYRYDNPGEIDAPRGFSHYLLTFFLTNNARQVTQIKGHGEYDGRMAQGEFYLCPAGYPSHTSWHDIDRTIHFIMTPRFIQQRAAEFNLAHPEAIELIPRLKAQDDKLERLVQLLLLEMSETNDNGFVQQLYLDSLSSALGIHLLRRYCNLDLTARLDAEMVKQKGLPHYKLNRILDYIHSHLDTNLSLSAMAEQVSLSRAYFATQFKQSMNVTPHQYVNQQRVEKAKRLLKKGDLVLAAIAADCGFSSQSHFNKVFRQYTNVSPKVYRDQL